MIDDFIIRRLCFNGMHKVDQNRWNFRCPICGDSSKDARKMRGWILKKENNQVIYCHNCFFSMPLISYIKEYEYDLYKDHIRSMIKSGRSINDTIHYKPKDNLINIIKNAKLNQAQIKDKNCKIEPIKLLSINDLDDDHICKKYVVNRKIPSEHFSRLFYTRNFQKFINSIVPNKFKKPAKTDMRLVIPLYTPEGKILAFQGRSIEKDAYLRYVTIKVIDHPKIFGLERVDINKDVFVLEGPIDSLFLDNCVAFAGADISYNDLDSMIPKNKSILMFDNEPRNKEISKKIFKAIKNGYRVVLLPYNFKKNGKDVNDWILNGLTSEEIQNTMLKYTYKGKLAEAKFKLWVKCKI